MKIIDVTKTLTPQTPLYPGDPNTLFEEITNQTRNGVVTITKMQIGSHSGTHMDAPAHIDPNMDTVTEFPLEWTQGQATIIEVEALSTAESVSRILSRVNCPRFLIIKCAENNQRFPSISDQLAFKLKTAGVHVIGTDLGSIDNEDFSALDNHHILLNKSIWVIENLDLSGVLTGPYGYTIAPLKLSIRDGAPVRVFLSDQHKNWIYESEDIPTKAIRIKNYMPEAENFVRRAGAKTITPIQLLNIAHLWVESDDKDMHILDSFSKINESLIENKGLIGVERGATLSDQHNSNSWAYHCEWRLSWDCSKGVIITLTTFGQNYQPHLEIDGTSSAYKKIIYDTSDIKSLETSLINCTIMEMYN